jgi:hypothetical protein
MLKKFKIFEDKINKKIDNIEDDEFYDYDYDYNSDDSKYDENSEDIENSEDEDDQLCYLIRTMFNNYNLSVLVEREDLDITINVFFEKKEKMKTILKAFDVAYKMKKDILPQYDSQVELFESRDGMPILSINFLYYDSDRKINNFKY